LITDAVRDLEKKFLAAIPANACQNCRGISPKYRTEGQTKIFEKPLAQKTIHTMQARNLTRAKLFPNEAEIQEGGDQDRFVSPLIVERHLELLWKEEKEILDLLYGSVKDGVRMSSHAVYFLSIVAVTPTKFRPISKMGDMTYEHPQNVYLTDILKANNNIQDIQDMQNAWFEGNPEAEQKVILSKMEEFTKSKFEAWVKLQESVNYLIDSSKAPMSGGKTAVPGVRQLLEKKEGLFRKHMMGKRVNFAARSVISPDPYIETNEIGIPPVFATKLTYPEPVTQHNFNELRQCVINGPEVWPGATHIQNEDGQLVSLAAFDEPARIGLANALLKPSVESSYSSHQFKNTNKKVLRHLRNGDFLLLNRQPTLHKPSIMAHTARVLPGERTIRMHYANCNTYNADFDGDEMNAHFPQNEIGRAEAMLIARTDQQYLVPTDGGVLRGLIQDHVDAGVDMCSRDTFLNREHYIQMVYAGLRESNTLFQPGNGNIEPQPLIGEDGRILIQAPSIIKPVPLWTGKQVISTILDNLTPRDRYPLNLISKARIPAKQWGPTAPEEQTVLIMDGQLLTGILDKSQFGASKNGLVHAVYEVYGPVYAGKLLSILGKLFTAYLQYNGFSCRMDDLLLTPKGDKIRRQLINESSSVGHTVAKEFTHKNDELEVRLGLEKVLRDTELMAGLDSAMKTQTNKITSEIIGSCVPDQLFKPFPQNNMQVMTVSGAKGSSVNVSQISCLLGQQELEGKRVPTMVSGKTLPSFPAFDPSSRAGGYITGRFLTGIKPQEYYFHCMAGREGLIDTAVKTSRSGYLQRCLIKHLEGIQVHYDHTVRDADGSILQFHYGEDSLDVCKQTTLTKFDFNALNYKALLKRYGPQQIASLIDEDSVKKYIKKSKKEHSKGDPVLSVFSPSRYIGAVSEKFEKNLTEYIEKNPSKLIKQKNIELPRPGWSDDFISASKFKGLMHLKYMHSLVEPGESVGLLAAQSIGEPSTQMTLNTFHFAGFGAKNVTLGIPRLREIIMTASSTIKTPLMRLPVHPHVTKDEQTLLCEQISKLVLSQLMYGVKVTEKLRPKTRSSERVKVVTVRLELWDKKHYLQQYQITASKLQKIIESSFIKALERAITRDLKGIHRKGVEDNIGIGVIEKPQSSSNAEDEGDRNWVDNQASDSEPEMDVDEGDATEERKKQKQTQQSTYDDDEDEANSEEDSEDEDGPKQNGAVAEEKSVEDTKYVSSIKFDGQNGSWCELTLEFPAETKKILMVALVEKVAQNLVIHEVKGIQRCFPQPNESENDTSVRITNSGKFRN
jgi:DNA-directed RNA polymerase I subunit RPA1